MLSLLDPSRGGPAPGGAGLQPSARPLVPQQQAAAAGSLMQPSDIHILLVDDERLSRKVVSNLLTSCHYKVTEAESGRKALDLLERSQPGTFQLILTDVMMPDVDGLGLLKAIRSQATMANLPVVMMSASDRQEMVCACINSGAEEYFVKPVTKKEVQNIWTHVMKRLSAHQGKGQEGTELAVSAAAAGPGPASTAAPTYRVSMPGLTLDPLMPIMCPPNLTPPMPEDLRARYALMAGISNVTASGQVQAPMQGAAGSTDVQLLAASAPNALSVYQQQAAANSQRAQSGAAAGPSGAIQQHQPQRKTQTVNMLRWLCRAGRTVQPKESFIVFCEVLLLLERFHAQSHFRSIKLRMMRPSHMVLFSNGKVGLSPAFMQALSSPATASATHAAAAAASGSGPVALGKAASSAGAGAGSGAGASSGMGAAHTHDHGRDHAAASVLGKRSSSAANLASGTQPGPAAKHEHEHVGPCAGHHNHDHNYGPAAPGEQVQPCSGDCAALSKHPKIASGLNQHQQLPTGAQSSSLSQQLHPDSGPGKARQEPPVGAAAAAAAAAGTSLDNRLAEANASGPSSSDHAPVMLPPPSGASHKQADGAGAGDSRCPQATDATAAQVTVPGLEQRQHQQQLQTQTQAQAQAQSVGLADAEEDAVYCSPEEAAGRAPTPASDMFSLGVLFFELFYVAPEGMRAQLLSDLRQRILPPQFLRHQPKEAAFALALLHPDPTSRPTLQELLNSDMFRDACNSLRQRHAQQQQQQPAAAEAEGGSENQVLVEFLKHLQQRKLGEMLKVQSDLEAIDSDISLVRAHLQHLQAMRAAKRRRAGGHIGAAAGAGTTPPGIGPGAKPALPTSSSYQTHTHTQHPSHSLQAGPSNSGPSNSQSSGGAGVGGAGAGAGSGPATSLHTQGDGPGHHHHHHVQDTATAAMSAHDEQQLLAAEEKWHRVAPVFAQLQSLYLQRRADALASQQPGTDQGRGHVDQGEAEVTPQRPQLAGGPSSAAAAGDARARDDGLRGVDGRAPGTPAGAMHTPPADAAAQPGSSGGSGQVGSGSAPAQAKTQQPQPLPPSQPLPQHMINFAQDLSKYAQYDGLQAVAHLRYGETLTASNMVCSAAFDRDDEFFATAGVSKRIKIYEVAGVVHNTVGLHYPVLEISSRSRLSSVCWSSYVKHHLACADYEGVVQLWDANTHSELVQYEEHAKRVWSIDFSPVDPSRLVSGSDDGTVRLWAINQDHSVATIHTKANVCSVHFSPDAAHLIAAGSANYKAYLYDLRHTAAPLAVIPGHSKAVSYVRFLGGTSLVTASTDSTLRLWDLEGMASGDPPPCSMLFQGHINERNFVGLSVTPDGYISCGSENNMVFCYYKSMPLPVTTYRFAGSEMEPLAGASLEPVLAPTSDAGHFVSSVTWSRRGNVLLAANSVGAIKLLSWV